MKYFIAIPILCIVGCFSTFEMTDEKPVAPPVDLDEIRRRYPPDISTEDFKRLIAHEREERAGWLDKQAAKGKEE